MRGCDIKWSAVTNFLLKEYFVNAVSGDYENLFFRSQIIKWAEEYQLTFSEEALLAAIDETIKDDLVSAYKYNSKIHSFEKCSLQMNSIDEYRLLKKGGVGIPS